LLEGRTVNLRVMERDDIDFLAECRNDINFWGEHNPIGEQFSKSELMKGFDNASNSAILIELKWFIIQKKDGIRIGLMYHRTVQPWRLMEIGCFFVPSERGKRFGTEATQLMIDYLFLSRNIVRIQAITNVGNRAARKALENVGLRIEGTIRKLHFVRGVWTDYYLLSILREEWKVPKILTKTA